MSRTRATSGAIRQTHRGSVVHVDFRSRHTHGLNSRAEFAHMVMTRAGVPIALGIAWLIVMFATIAFAHDHARKGEMTGVAPVRADDVTGGAISRFDAANLPPVDSIDAHTDIRGFLRKGVPVALHRAALMRAWTTDPAIRDFRAMQENDWDFNSPNSIPGFCEALVLERCPRTVSATLRVQR